MMDTRNLIYLVCIRRLCKKFDLFSKGYVINKESRKRKTNIALHAQRKVLSFSLRLRLSPNKNNKVSIQLSIQSYCFNKQMSSGSQVKTSTYTGSEKMKNNSCLER
ncbi:hypothetical protein Droror1_Dr00028079 [Drosera rotundifolia]